MSERTHFYCRPQSAIVSFANCKKLHKAANSPQKKSMVEQGRAGSPCHGCPTGLEHRQADGKREKSLPPPPIHPSSLSRPIAGRRCACCGGGVPRNRSGNTCSPACAQAAGSHVEVSKRLTWS